MAESHPERSAIPHAHRLVKVQGPLPAFACLVLALQVQERSPEGLGSLGHLVPDADPLGEVQGPPEVIGGRRMTSRGRQRLA
jgi:hypothetical protein